jgi:hypothetical protein
MPLLPLIFSLKDAIWLFRGDQYKLDGMTLGVQLTRNFVQILSFY